MNASYPHRHELERAAADRAGADPRRRRRRDLGAWPAISRPPSSSALPPRSRQRCSAATDRHSRRPATCIAAPTEADADERVAQLEARLARVENATQRAEGFAGRADALVVAFAARRAIDRGVALGYLETLLVDRFGAQHQRAVATIITASRQPVRLNDLIAEYETLGPELRRGGPQDSWWTNFKRELGSLVEVHRADTSVAERRRALQAGAAAPVGRATSTRRWPRPCACPARSRAGGWIAKARRYVAAHRALDEIESAALLARRQSRATLIVH